MVPRFDHGCTKLLFERPINCVDAYSNNDVPRTTPCAARIHKEVPEQRKDDLSVQGNYPWVAAIYPIYPMIYAVPTEPAAFPPSYRAPMSPAPSLPIMAGGEPMPVSSHLRVYTTTTADGTIRTCLVPNGLEYRRGDRLEVLRAQRTREGTLFYLVLRDGCAGWVPAEHLAIARRRRMGSFGSGDGNDDSTESENWDWEVDVSDDEGMGEAG